MGRLRELVRARLIRNGILFTSAQRRRLSVLVRGDQIAEETGGLCLRSRYVTPEVANRNQALIWIASASADRIAELDGSIPQLFDVIFPQGGRAPDARSPTPYLAFRYLIVNTPSTAKWIGPPPDRGWKTWVIPHHHCNRDGYRLPEARLASPRVVGYVGERTHLHDEGTLRRAVEEMGMVLRLFPSSALEAYKEIDIGVAWTGPDERRDQSRSNVKLVNFQAHGIPCVVCDYESYRAVDEALGGSTCLIRQSLEGFIEGLAELVASETLRHTLSKNGLRAFVAYSRRAIASKYRECVKECRAEWESRRTER